MWRYLSSITGTMLWFVNQNTLIQTWARLPFERKWTGWKGMGWDWTRLNCNSNGFENTTDYHSWMVNEIHQYRSQQTWVVFTIQDHSTVLSCLYHKILLVLIKTCILQKFSGISCVCSLVFELDILIFQQYRWDLMILMRLNDRSRSILFITNPVWSSNHIFCWMSGSIIFLIEQDEIDH